MGQVLFFLSGYSLLPVTVLDLFQSWPAGIVIAAAIIALVIFFLIRYLADRLNRNCRDLISPFIEQGNRGLAELSERIAHTEKALAAFSDAMQEYSKHMASHTSAIQGLSEASQSLKNSAMEQNLILDRLSHTLEEEKHMREVTRVERTVIELEKRTALVLQVKDELEHKSPRANEAVAEKVQLKVPVRRPPGCQVKPRALYYA
jgi:hypothetical protein